MFWRELEYPKRRGARALAMKNAPVVLFPPAPSAPGCSIDLTVWEPLCAFPALPLR